MVFKELPLIFPYSLFFFFPPCKFVTQVSGIAQSGIINCIKVVFFFFFHHAESCSVWPSRRRVKTLTFGLLVSALLRGNTLFAKLPTSEVPAKHAEGREETELRREKRMKKLLMTSGDPKFGSGRRRRRRKEGAGGGALVGGFRSGGAPSSLSPQLSSWGGSVPSD